MNARSVGVVKLLTVSAPQFKDPVTIVGPVIVVFQELTAKPLLPAETTSQLVALTVRAFKVSP